jgi:peptidoglycan hydrolase-like protein with peptidoglycan-binding domain
MNKYFFTGLLLSVFLSFSGSAFADTALPVVCTSLTTNLASGSTGTQVVSLQNFLSASGFLSVPSSGYFGPLTKDALMNFQASQQVPQVGSVGPMTRASIKTVSCTTTKAPAPAVLGTSTVAIVTAPVATTTPEVVAPTSPTLPYRADTFYDWKSTWGDVSTTSKGSLLLQGTVDTNGAEAVFPASKDWDNYRYTANVSVANSNITLIARYVDENNFVACSFSKDWVQITQRQYGTTTILASKYVPGVLNAGGAAISTAVAITVKGHSIGCAALGPDDNLSFTIRGTEPLTGAVGIQTYYDTPFAARLELLGIKVDPL